MRHKRNGKPSSHIVPSGGPIPPPPPSNIHRPAIPMYINVSPKSPAPPLGNETPRINRPMPIDDTPMTKRPSHGDDSDRAYQPESYYETAGPPKGPVPPHSSTTPETSEYIGWTPLPKNKYALSKYDDKSPPARPATSDYIRAPGIPNDEEQQNEVLDPYITPKTPKYENALARNKPSPTEELNTSGAYGRAGPKNPGTHQVWKSNEVKQTSGMDDPPREEQDSSDKESTGSYERKKDRQHLNVGRPTSPGITPGLGAETNPYLPGTETFTSRNAMAGGRSSGTAEVVGKKELPTISISMSNKQQLTHSRCNDLCRRSLRCQAHHPGTSIPCCPPPPPVQCCPQPPVCCQPPPPQCCPPPVVCCSVPTIPTCFRACPACPCRRRLHAALRMKRSPGTPSSSCTACKRSDTRTARVKRMGCLPCGKRKKRDIEEEHHRRVKRLVDGDYDSMYTCDKSCCDYDRFALQYYINAHSMLSHFLLNESPLMVSECTPPTPRGDEPCAHFSCFSIFRDFIVSFYLMNTTQHH
ncbi:hypothetical protein ANCCEY_09583 [Ancylostoma ceylanicum]|uniref:Uncharacterized protein n=1 Tax=Ancylostoma ceylanicum TaxID=53326 RepID=A0A0D6LMS9_9BILA|nr:hypothetical protein ANCCEY_09583 [Ancylostoma ceylanicum]